uniref:Uncharacterized protein n=1 Tax=viral metagenome TaxID=1070528 RepID=A0A6C0JAK6_9ZZZZ
MCENRANQCNVVYENYATDCFITISHPVFECKILTFLTKDRRFFLDNQSTNSQTFIENLKECLSDKQIEIIELC